VKKIDAALKQEAIQLRVERRLSVKAISRLTGLSVGTVSALVRPFPLSQEEIQQRLTHAATHTNQTKGRYAPEASRWLRCLAGIELTRSQKGQVAEAAALFRLALHGFQVWKCCQDGDPADWLATKPGCRHHVRLQVKWARRDQYGRPRFRTLRRFGRGQKPIDDTECDFIVAYDLETDTAFVVPVKVVKQSAIITCHPRFAEAWHLIKL
jgi:hypothetical protein